MVEYRCVDHVMDLATSKSRVTENFQTADMQQYATRMLGAA